MPRPLEHAPPEVAVPGALSVVFLSLFSAALLSIQGPQSCVGAGLRAVGLLLRLLYEQFRQLIPDPPLQAGTVIEVGSGVVTVALPGGGRIKARGSAALGQKVFVRDDAIEGIAPSLTLEIIEI